MLPSPSWPASLEPQQYASSSAVTPQVCVTGTERERHGHRGRGVPAATLVQNGHLRRWVDGNSPVGQRRLSDERQAGGARGRRRRILSACGQPEDQRRQNGSPRGHQAVAQAVGRAAAAGTHVHERLTRDRGRRPRPRRHARAPAAAGAAALSASGVRSTVLRAVGVGKAGAAPRQASVERGRRALQTTPTSARPARGRWSQRRPERRTPSRARRPPATRARSRCASRCCARAGCATAPTT